tara:strand:+ start:286 stop:1710 length:1425 start_codon:yes stop_codon:yes gene_type:complete
MANTIRLKRASGSDPGASDLVTGELAVRTDTGKLFTKKDDNSVTEIGAAGNAASADTVDVSGVTTNSALQVLFSTANDGQARTIAVDSTTSKFTYNPSSNTLDVDTVVGNLTGNVTGNTSGSSGSCTGNAATATALETARTIAGVSFDGSANISLNNNAITNGAGYITATLTNEQVQDIVGGMVSGNTESGITVTYQDSDGTLDFSVTSQTDNNFTTTLKNKLDGIASGATNVTNNNQLTNGAGYITATLTNEQVQDIVGGMVSGNTESGITVTYQDGDGTLDFSVASQTDNNFTTTLKNKLDGIASGATNVTNTNQLTNGAGFITSADGGNAATLDGVDSSQFLRSDATDSSNSKVSFNGGIAVEDTCTSTITTLSDGSTVSPSFITSIHHVVTLGGNRTLSHQDTASAVGQCGSIFIVQDSSGSRTLSFNSAYKFASGTAPTLSTAANAVDRIDYIIRANDVIHCAFTADVK